MRWGQGSLELDHVPFVAPLTKSTRTAMTSSSVLLSGSAGTSVDPTTPKKAVAFGLRVQRRLPTPPSQDRSSDGLPTSPPLLTRFAGSLRAMRRRPGHSSADRSRSMHRLAAPTTPPAENPRFVWTWRTMANIDGVQGLDIGDVRRHSMSDGSCLSPFGAARSPLQVPVIAWDPT